MTFKQDSSVSHESSVGGHLKRALSISPAFLVTALVATVQMLAVIRTLTPHEYAGYVIALAAAAATTGVLGDASANAIVRFRAGGDMEATQAGLRASVVVAAVVSLAAAGVLIWSGHPTLALGSAVMSASQVMVRQQTALVRASERIALYGKVVSLLALVQGAAIVTAAIVTGQAIWLIWATAAVNIIFGIALMPMTRQEISQGGRATRAAARRFASYAAPVALTAVGGQVLSVSDRFIVEQLSGASELASYYANYVIAERPAGLIFAPMLAAIQPMIFRLNDGGDTRGAAMALSRLMDLFVCISIPLAIFVSFFGDDLSAILTGGKYPAGAHVIPVVICAVTMWNMAQIVHQPLEISRRTSVITVFVGIAALVNVAANFWLVPLHGGLGAAYGTLISFSLYLVCVLIYVRARCPFSAGMPIKMIAIALLSSFAIAFGMNWLTAGLSAPVRLGTAILAGGIAALALLAIQRRESFSKRGVSND